MIFVTRKLYDGVQTDSGWERRAEREWEKRSAIYGRYYKILVPLLPASVRRLHAHGLHDAVVESAKQSTGKIELVMNTKGALTRFRGRHVRLIFSDVHRRINLKGLVGQWWLYHEVHLCSHAGFSFHVMFTESDIEIDANDLSVRMK